MQKSVQYQSLKNTDMFFAFEPYFNPLQPGVAFLYPQTVFHETA